MPSDPSGPTSPIGFSPPPRCAARIQASAVPSWKSPAPIGRTRLFPHSVNMPYDMPIRSALPPTPETSGDWESMVYPAGEGVGAVRRTAPAAEIIRQMMSQAYDILDDRAPAPRPKVNPGNFYGNFQQGVAYFVFRP